MSKVLLSIVNIVLDDVELVGGKTRRQARGSRLSAVHPSCRFRCDWQKTHFTTVIYTDQREILSVVKRTPMPTLATTGNTPVVLFIFWVSCPTDINPRSWSCWLPTLSALSVFPSPSFPFLVLLPSSLNGLSLPSPSVHRGLVSFHLHFPSHSFSQRYPAITIVRR